MKNSNSIIAYELIDLNIYQLGKYMSGKNEINRKNVIKIVKITF